MQKIVPSLWFDKNCEEAIKFYTSVFSTLPGRDLASGGPNSKIDTIQHYPEGSTEPHMQGMEGKVLTGIFELEGYKFMALDGGPYFKFTPAISFFVNCETEEEIDALWGKLSEGGKVMMEFQKYPFSEKYGWCSDKYGVSWQLNLVKADQKIIPSLLFTQDKVGGAEEAINFYTSLFPNSEVTTISRYEKGDYDKEGLIKYSLFKLAGESFSAMESTLSHEFTFNEAVSLYVECEDQEEVDRLWEKLSAVPESEQCGWVKDKYGVSWQIIPKQLGELLSDPDKEKAGRVINAMLQMKKISVADLQKAYNGE